MTETKPIEVTEADVLRGSMVAALQGRDGKPRQVEIKSVPWRVAVDATFLTPQQSVPMVLASCVKAEDLNALPPIEYFRIHNAIRILTDGLDALKKATPPTEPTEIAAPSLETSSLSKAS